MLGRALSHAYRWQNRRTTARHAIVSGSLGVGNLGDDALLAAFLSRHAGRYRGITVLTSAGANELPGKQFLSDGAREQLPDRLSLMQLPRLGVSGPNVRNLLSRLVTESACLAHVPGATIDYVLLGGLLGHRGHMTARLRELRWARAFADRAVYYFGDADFKPEDRDVAVRVTRELGRGQHFVSVRSEEAAALLNSVNPSLDVRVGTDIVLARYALDASTLPPRSPGQGVVINPSGSRIEETTPIWLAAAEAAVSLGLSIDWVSFSDLDDLPLCGSLSQEAGARYGGQHRVVPASEALATLAQARTCIATRFHCHIFAYCMGVPVLSVPFGGKTARLVRALGLDRWELSRSPAVAETRQLLLEAPNAWPALQTKLKPLVTRHAQVTAEFDASLT